MPRCRSVSDHLLNRSRNRAAEREYWAKKKEQLALDEENAVLTDQGLPVKQIKFEPDKDKLCEVIRTALPDAVSFEDFSEKLLRRGITVKGGRGRLSYLTPDQTKAITARKLDDDFDKAAVFAIFVRNASRAYWLYREKAFNSTEKRFHCFGCGADGDVLLYDPIEERAALIKDYGKEVIKLERRISELGTGAEREFEDDSGGTALPNHRRSERAFGCER